MRYALKDNLILSWVTEGYTIPFHSTPKQDFIPSSKVYSLDELNNMQTAIDELLELGAIAECSPCEEQYISSIFLVPKPNGKNKFILSLKSLNKFITTKQFKMEHLRTTLKLI